MINRPLILSMFVSLILCFSTTSITAQNYERYSPLDLTRPDRSSVQKLDMDAGDPKLPDVNVNDQVLVDSLDAIVIVDNSDKLSQEESIDELTGVHYNFNDTSSLIYSNEMKAILQRELGRPITLRRLNEISRDIILQYKKCKQPIVDVQIPEQRITGGTVQFVVIESRIGKVIVKPDCHFSCEEIAHWVNCARPGRKIYEPWIESDLIWLNQNPFRRVGVDFKPGSLPGTTDVIYEVNDVRPIRGYIGADDTGVPALNYGRFFTGFTYGDLFNRGGILGYQYTTDESFGLLHAHSVSYSQPIDRQWSWFNYGSIADVTPMLGAGLNQSGQSWQVGAGTIRHLVKDRNCQANATLGVDFKVTDNTLEFAGQTVANTTADLLQLRIGYDLLWRAEELDEYAVMRLDSFIGPGGGFSPNHNLAAFQTLRPGSSPDYIYGRIFLERSRVLADQWQLQTRFHAQASSERVLFSETLGIGGFDTVRGYDERAFNADHGWIANMEFGPKTYRWGCNQNQRVLRTFGFIDMANGYVERAQAGEDAYAMAISVGSGLRFQASDRLIARVDYGVGLRDNIANVARDHRVHFGVTWIPGTRP